MRIETDSKIMIDAGEHLPEAARRVALELASKLGASADLSSASLVPIDSGELSLPRRWINYADRCARMPEIRSRRSWRPAFWALRNPKDK